MKIFCTDRKGAFISAKLKNIYNKKGVIIKYTATYIYIKNGPAK